MPITQSLIVREIPGSIDYVANTSVVEILWTSTQSGTSKNENESIAAYYVSINGGAEQVNYEYYILPANTTQTIVSERIKVKHREDGTGTVRVRTWMDTGIGAGVYEETKTITLTQITRETTLDSLTCDTRYLNGTITVGYTQRDASYENHCNIYLLLNGQEINIRSLVLGSQSPGIINLTEEELALIYSKIPNTSEATLRFELLTLTNVNYIGYDQVKDITLHVPSTDETQPTMKMVLSPVSSMPSPFNTFYIKGKTKVDADFSNGVGKYGADIVSYRLIVGGKGYGQPYISEYLTTAGSVSVNGTVTDTRGISRTYKEVITVLDYEEPQILPANDEDRIICERCEADGHLSDTGTYLKIKAKRGYAKVILNDVQYNFCTIRYRYKEETSNAFSPWVTILEDGATTDTIDITIPEIVSSLETAYVVQLGVVDYMGNTKTITYLIPTEYVTIDIPEEHKGKRIGIGRYVGDEDGIYFGLPVFGGFGDTVTEVGTRNVDDRDPSKGYWRYRLWRSGAIDISGTVKVSPITEPIQGGIYPCRVINLVLPFEMKDIQFTASISIGSECFVGSCNSVEGDNKQIAIKLYSFLSKSGFYAYDVSIIASGKLI